MRLGIFARTFSRPTLDDLLQAVRGCGLTCVHFNLKCIGAEALLERMEDSACERIRSTFETHGVEMVAVSATFNAIHPDRAHRAEYIHRARCLIERATSLGTRHVSLCTGTRDTENMWASHPDNSRPDAWADLLATLGQLVPAAEAAGVTLCVEPEKANVIDSAARARQLLDELKSDRLRIIIDGANLFEPDDLSDMRDVLREAFELLGPDIIMAHAKDITGDPQKQQQAAGTGRLDWEAYFDCMHAAGFDGPVILHNLAESQVAESLAFVRRHATKRYPELRIGEGAT